MEQGGDERAERIEWVSSVADVAIMSVAISRVLIRRDYRLAETESESMLKITLHEKFVGDWGGVRSWG